MFTIKKISTPPLSAMLVIDNVDRELQYIPIKMQWKNIIRYK